MKALHVVKVLHMLKLLLCQMGDTSLNIGTYSTKYEFMAFVIVSSPR